MAKKWQEALSDLRKRLAELAAAIDDALNPPELVPVPVRNNPRKNPKQ